jgi:hypothetical protein
LKTPKNGMDSPFLQLMAALSNSELLISAEKFIDLT